jgi:hypothetical protein
LVVFVGRGVLRSARTTCWPAVRPDVIWVLSVPAYPVLARTRVVTPFLRVKATACPFPSGVRAEFGTVSTFVAVPIRRLTSAREPDASAGSATGTRTTTGYTGELDVVDVCPVPAPWVVVLPAEPAEVDVDVDGRRLMELTAPGTELVVPCGDT